MPVDENEKTRAELIAMIDGLFTDPEPHSITPSQIQDLLKKIVTSMFMKLDEFTYPATVETLEIASPSSGLTVDGRKVIGEQQSHVTHITDDDVDTMKEGGLQNGITFIKDKFNDLITKLESHGIIAQ